MYKRSDFDFLSDIKEAINRINAYLKNAAYKDFLEDIKTQDAVINEFCKSNRNNAVIASEAKQSQKIDCFVGTEFILKR